MSEANCHGQSSSGRLRQSFAEAADEITERLERLENCMQPSFPSVDSWRVQALEASNEQLSATVGALNDEVADLSSRLERMECLLMCSNFDHVTKIDKLLRQLKEEILKEPPEHQGDESLDKLASIRDPMSATQPCCLGRYDFATAFTDGVLQVWPNSNKRPGELAAITDDQKTHPRSIDESTAPPSDIYAHSTARSVLVDSSTCPSLEVSALLANDKQAQENLDDTAESLEQKAVSLGEPIEQTKPIRFWREAEDNKKTREELAVSLNNHTPSPTAMIEPLIEQEPPKQCKIKGWDLKAEAAAKGKRIGPKRDPGQDLVKTERGVLPCLPRS